MTELSKDAILADLSAPFDPDLISWRVGSTNKRKWENAGKPDSFDRRGLPLAYLDARDVMQRLDDVMGVDWQCNYSPMPNGTCCCNLGIRIDGEWFWRSNGAGASDMEGDKGQYSDAFKRAAVLFGVGQYLYSTKAPWVSLNKFWQIEKEEFAALRGVLIRASEQAVQISAYKVRKSGRWSEAMADLKNAIERGKDQVGLVRDEWKSEIATWPDEFQKSYDDALKRAMELAP